jgi:hypothetical protein
MQVDLVEAITAALNRADCPRTVTLGNPCSAYVNAVLVPDDSSLAVDDSALASMGVQYVGRVESRKNMDGQCFFDAERLVAHLTQLLTGTQDASARM